MGRWCERSRPTARRILRQRGDEREEPCREKAQKTQPGRAGTKGARPSGRFTDGLAPAASGNPDPLGDKTRKRPEGRAPVAGENLANNARFSPIAVQNRNERTSKDFLGGGKQCLIFLRTSRLLAAIQDHSQSMPSARRTMKGACGHRPPCSSPFCGSCASSRRSPLLLLEEGEARPTVQTGHCAFDIKPRAV
jgi:hypothetical protein